ncbi:MAG TPA: EAL domain-containing protein [Acidimicrobiales bacterium]|nr:EAL domain-containing protein [Acidimicrobiales bacterium]
MRTAGAVVVGLLAAAALAQIGEQLSGVSPVAGAGGWALVGSCISVLALVVHLGRRWVRLERDLVDRLGPDGTAGDTAAARSSEADHKHRVQAVVNAGERLRVVYQPLVGLGDGECVGYEALARFDGSEPPTEWFQEAHELGLGVELEILAVRRAMEGFGADGLLCVNVGPETLTCDALLELVEHCPFANRVVLELTEHAVVDDYEGMRRALVGLRRMGIRVAVDDTGSGFASMRHIVDLQPDIVKVDRSLVTGIHLDGARRSLAESLAAYAGAVGATLVAEGIETVEELGACRQVGFHHGQGYLFGRPAPAPWLRQANAPS